MDNLTHTLAGALIGEAFSRFGAGDGSALAVPQRRSMLVGLSVLCSNLPDVDVLYTFAAGSKLDYLTEHRGYTHTIAGVLVAAVLVMAAVELGIRWRRLSPTAMDRKTLASAIGL